MTEDESVAMTLEEARRLARERAWADLARFDPGVAAAASAEQPELAYLVADALRRVGELDRSMELARAAADGAARATDERLRLRSDNLMGMLHFDIGCLEEAEAVFSTLLSRATEAGDHEFAARASNNLGVIASIRGERELALTAYQRAIAAYQRLGYARGLAQTYYNVAIVYRDLGFPDETESNLSLGRRWAEESGSEDVIALVDTERAILFARSGDGYLAEQLAERALQLMHRLADPFGSANALRALALAADARADATLAIARLDEALRAVERHPDLLLRAEIQRDRASLLFRSGNRSAAEAALRDSVESFRQLGAVRDAEATEAILPPLP